jgi:alanine racemase
MRAVSIDSRPCPVKFDGGLSWDVSLGALERNVDRVRAHVPAGTLLICSVKANAYGHGVLTVGRALDALGVDCLATASGADAVRLREAGVRARILLFGGHPPEAAPWYAGRGLTVTVANLETADALAPGSPVFVKVDAGLGRLGIPLEEAREVIVERVAPRLAIDGIYTHLPFHDPAGEWWARAGLRAFRSLVAELDAAGLSIPVAQALSSPGISAGLPVSGNAVCPGRLLYGLVPSAGHAAEWGFEPVLRRISTRVSHVRTYSADRRVGPGGRRAVHAGDSTAVIPFGRRHGNLTDPAQRPVVIHRGRRVPVIGVSLEHATLWFGSEPVEIGDEVVVLGDGDGDRVSLEELSRWSHLDPLDALVALDRGTAV